MRYLGTCASLLGIALFLAISAVSAHAQATRTWVSGVGDDANPCSRTAPCKTFAGAISKTAAGGEINVLDPGGFGAVTITKSISIIADHVEGGVLVSGTNGIVISAAGTDRVVLEGLDIEGLGTGINGVNVLNAGAGLVYVIRCSIRHFAQNGVLVGTSTAGTRVFIKDSFIGFNGVGASDAGGVKVNGSAANSAELVNTLVDGNSNFAVRADGATNVVAFFHSTLSGSPTGVSLLNGGTAVSFGPSNVITGAGAPTTTVNFR